MTASERNETAERLPDWILRGKHVQFYRMVRRSTGYDDLELIVCGKVLGAYPFGFSVQDCDEDAEIKIRFVPRHTIAEILSADDEE